MVNMLFLVLSLVCAAGSIICCIQYMRMRSTRLHVNEDHPIHEDMFDTIQEEDASTPDDDSPHEQLQVQHIYRAIESGRDLDKALLQSKRLVESHPENTQYRLMLLNVLAEKRSFEEFDNELQRLYYLGDEQANQEATILLNRFEKEYARESSSQPELIDPQELHTQVDSQKAESLPELLAVEPLASKEVEESIAFVSPSSQFASLDDLEASLLSTSTKSNLISSTESLNASTEVIAASPSIVDLEKHKTDMVDAFDGLSSVNIASIQTTQNSQVKQDVPSHQKTLTDLEFNLDVDIPSKQTSANVSITTPTLDALEMLEFEEIGKPSITQPINKSATVEMMVSSQDRLALLDRMESTLLGANTTLDDLEIIEIKPPKFSTETLKLEPLSTHSPALGNLDDKASLAMDGVEIAESDFLDLKKKELSETTSPRLTPHFDVDLDDWAHIESQNLNATALPVLPKALVETHSTPALEVLSLVVNRPTDDELKTTVPQKDVISASLHNLEIALPTDLKVSSTPPIEQEKAVASITNHTFAKSIQQNHTVEDALHTRGITDTHHRTVGSLDALILDMSSDGEPALKKMSDPAIRIDPTPQRVSTEMQSFISNQSNDDVDELLALAEQYVALGDKHAAKDLLMPVIEKGTIEQATKAEEILK